MKTEGSPDTECTRQAKLKPPPDDNPAGSSKPATAPLTAFGVMIVLLVAAGAVLFVLPRFIDNNVERSTEPAPLKRTAVVEAPLPPAHDAENSTHPEENPQGAARQLEVFLALKSQAERENVSAWAESTYQEILALEQKGDRYFTAKEYLKAEEIYSRAAGDLQNLLGTRQQVLHELLDQGYRLLSEERGREALDSFTRALAMAPDNEEARTGARRAENRDTVVALYRSARALEQSGALSAAENALAELEQLDSTYPPAQALSDRVRERLEKLQFEQQMSLFFIDLQKQNLGQAREALGRLKETAAGDPQVIRAEEMLVAKEETARLDTLRKRGETLSAAEAWEEALAMYRQALTISPDALFAVNGVELARKRVDLDQALENSLNQPHRLQEDAQLEAAKQLLDYARQFSPGGARLSGQINRLERLVTHASTPVPVTLNSDNKTSIAIYHVGKMGTFFSTQITLKPGRYTAVGSRNGFHDVRETFVVDPGKRDNQLFIACREPI